MEFPAGMQRLTRMVVDDAPFCCITGLLKGLKALQAEVYRNLSEESSSGLRYRKVQSPETASCRLPLQIWEVFTPSVRLRTPFLGEPSLP